MVGSGPMEIVRVWPMPSPLSSTGRPNDSSMPPKSPTSFHTSSMPAPSSASSRTSAMSSSPPSMERSPYRLVDGVRPFRRQHGGGGLVERVDGGRDGAHVRLL